MADPRCPYCDLPVPPGDDFTLRAELPRVDTLPAGVFIACGVHARCCEPLLGELGRRLARRNWAVETWRTPGR